MHLQSNSVSIANSRSKNYFDAEFVIGGFEENSNNDKVNRDTIENWLPTLLFTHLVGNIRKNAYGNYDFSDHEVKKIILINDDGSQTEDYILNTKGFGTCIKSEIKEIDNKEFIVATFRVFNRYTNASNLIKQRIANGTLYSSWEIAIKKYHYEDKTRVIDDGEFLSHCVLGEDVIPACEDAKLLNVASNKQNIEEVLLQDMERNGELMKKEDVSKAQVQTTGLDNDESKIEPVVANQVAENTDNSIGNEPVTGSLTDSDIYSKLKKVLRSQLGYCYISYLYPIDQIALVKVDEGGQKELEFKQVKYSVDNDNVTITETKDVELVVKPTEINVFATEINTKLELANKSLETATASIKDLQDKVVELEVYKVQVEEIQEKQALAQKEAKQKALVEKLHSLCELSDEDIEQNGTLKTAIASLDETAINSFIVENMLNKSNDISTASTDDINVKTDINTAEDNYDLDGSVMRNLF
ncbi:MAG: hypothetical protein ACTTKD_07640 [Peptoanaerobacter stomatis]|uniref:hypothetical protein n=1 Tax=Peptoanaerobacter stomatis TaxID=796937 RepID=UPI003F9ECC47